MTAVGHLPEALRDHLTSLDATGCDDPATATGLALEVCRTLIRAEPATDALTSWWGSLFAVGRVDLTLARLVEGHLDAVTICRELGGPVPGEDELWGVWAAHDPALALRAGEDREGHWTITGAKGWCSGAGGCTHALVTAQTPGGIRLFAVALDGVTCPVPGSWAAVGMSGSGSATVTFTAAPATPVGDAGAYLARPGFWPGGGGVAAVWLGGAHGVADALAVRHAAGGLGEHALAHAGAVDAALFAGRSALGGTAAAMARDASDPVALRVHARRLRTVAESTSRLVLDHVGRALGAGPLARDRAHARRCADLAVYVRQHHAERDEAALGLDVLALGTARW